jgi:transcription antitermination factor NusG
MTWWAIQAQSQSEEHIYHKLVDRGYVAFWPHVSEWVATGHKEKSRLLRRSWLTGYLFVEVERQDLWAVRELPGVGSIVRGASTEPSPIPTEWVTELMLRCDHWGGVLKTQKLPRRNKFRTGDVVRITDETSPLHGLSIKITEALDNGSVRAVHCNDSAGRITIIDLKGDIVE